MATDPWDWNDIYVVDGGWWLVAIGLALLLVGLAVGYLLGRRAERAYLEREGWEPPGYDLGTSDAFPPDA